VLAGLVLLLFINRYKDDVNAGLAPAPVLTADRLIPAGTSGSEVVAGKHFEAVAVPTDKLEAGAVTAAADLTGKVAVNEVLPGEQILASDFAAAGDPIRSRLTKTERAVQIPIDGVAGMIGTLRPGDRIDILAAFNGGGGNAGGSAAASAVRPLIDDVRVMAIGQGSVILESTDRQAGKLAFAADNAKLYFLLRPLVGAKDSKPTVVGQSSINEFEISGSVTDTEDGQTFSITGQAGE
jgi:Flp pilus assembly protein CpaB